MICCYNYILITNLYIVSSVFTMFTISFKKCKLNNKPSHPYTVRYTYLITLPSLHFMTYVLDHSSIPTLYDIQTPGPSPFFTPSSTALSPILVLLVLLKVPAEYYESVTVYFSDIVGFTQIAAISTPFEVL